MTGCGVANCHRPGNIYLNYDYRVDRAAIVRHGRLCALHREQLSAQIQLTGEHQ